MSASKLLNGSTLDGANCSFPLKPRRKYVYAIGDDHDGPIKIGVSARPRNRLRELQVANPSKLKILSKFRGDEQDESALHRLLVRARLNGEWFQREAALQA